MAESLKKADPSDKFVMEMSERKALVARFAGRTIHTVWGPSRVGKLSSDFKHVILYEQGSDERFDLTFSDFKESLEDHGEI